MVFSGLTFLLLFLPATLGLYFLSPSIRWKNAVLLTASLVFYAWGEPMWILPLVCISLLVWLASLGTVRCRGAARKLCLALGVLLPMGVLAVTKYGNFLLAPVLGLAGITLPSISMPLGISFFTFQIVTYAVDVYRDPEEYQRSPLRLLLYISCFPQLIAGPIVRYGEVKKALEDRTTTPDDFIDGMQRFACGLGKKVLLANLCGKIVSATLANQAAYGMSVAGSWYMALLYALQIYFDFSGYSDMAIGLGRVFGFRYAENFNYPYLSTSIRDFWRRWHISLGSFFREYVYIPLGGSRKGAARTLLNLFVVWALTGLWHGANWNFVLWGLYFFVLLALERFVIRDHLDRVPGVIRGFAVFLLLLIGWVIFYFTDSAQLLQYLGAMFGLNGTPLVTAQLRLVLAKYTFLPLVALIAAFPVAKRLPFAGSRTARAIALTVVFVLSVIFIVGQSYNPFIYFRF